MVEGMTALHQTGPCAMPHCNHDAQRVGGLCSAHLGLLWRFSRWLEGSPAHDALSFDRDRAAVERGA